jgi:hypothetical protein
MNGDNPENWFANTILIYRIVEKSKMIDLYII